MRILFISGSAWGGSLSSTRELASALRDEGYACYLLARSDLGERLQPWLHKRLENLHARCHDTWLRPLSNHLLRIPGRRLVRCDSGPEAVPEWRCRVPANGAKALIERLTPDVLVVASVLRPQWRQIREIAGRFGVPCWLYLREPTSVEHLTSEHSPDGLVANSLALQQVARRRGFECSFVPSPISLPSLPLERVRRHVLLVNFGEQYGQHLALRIAEASPDISFVFQDSWKADLLRVRAMRKELAARRIRNVEVRPFVEDAVSLYSGARLLLVPYPTALSDSRPRCVVEALACGLPIVGSLLPGLKEIVGEAGVLLHPTADPEAWARVIRVLFADETRYAALARMAVARYASLDVGSRSVAKRFALLLDEGRDLLRSAETETTTS